MRFEFRQVENHAKLEKQKEEYSQNEAFRNSNGRLDDEKQTEEDLIEADYQKFFEQCFKKDKLVEEEADEEENGARN